MSSDAFGGASSASRRVMWKREITQQQLTSPTTSRGDAAAARISLPNGEQIHDIAKLYEKRCIKDEQRKAHRFMQDGSRSAREPLQRTNSRQPLDPERSLALKLHDTPDAYYDTDCGNKKSLQRSLKDATNPCLSAFSSTKDRFTSTAAYRASTFASVVKEPYATPEAIGPGTYRAKKRAIHVKKQQVPTPSYMSKSTRFEDANAHVSAVLSTIASLEASSTSSKQSPKSPSHDNYVVSSQRPEQRVRSPQLSTTPRFKSQCFPERYASSKEHRRANDSPDRFYDISPSCKYTVEASVQSSSFRCSTMQSRANRLSSEAAMVHNTPRCPILPSPTKNTVGPGAYNVSSPARMMVTTQEDANYIMMPQRMDRFGLPGMNVGFIEARFRRFALDPESPSTDMSMKSSPRRPPTRPS